MNGWAGTIDLILYIEVAWLRYYFNGLNVIRSLLHSGAFGAVYRCSLNGFSCAVKIMTIDTTEDMHYIRQEICILERLKHENIVTYLGMALSISR